MSDRKSPLTDLSPMRKSDFDEVVLQIIQEDSRYAEEAYIFVREGLDHTLKSLKRTGQATVNRHVSGHELLEGLRDYTIKEFGPTGRMVLEDWGIHSSEDFGHVVFNLVNHGVLGKSENDKLEDFMGAFCFEDAFDTPFMPSEADNGSHSSGRASGSQGPESSTDIKSPSPSQDS